MKKYLSILVLFAFVYAADAQTKGIQISWETLNQTSTKSAQTQSKKTGQEAVSEILKLDIGHETPKYTTQWEDSNFVDPSSLKVTNVRYEPLSSNELSIVDKNFVPTNLTYNIATTEAREKLYTIFNISPIVRLDGAFQKVVSFTIDYKYGVGRRSLDPPPVMNSVLAQGQWFKFKVEKTGIHKIRSEEHTLNSSHVRISYAVFCLKKKNKQPRHVL